MGPDPICPKAFTQEEEMDRSALRSHPNAVGRQARKRPNPELPLIGAKRPEIRFLHENSKNIPAGSNPSKRHLADRGIVVPSDQERKTGQSQQSRSSQFPAGG